MRHSWFSFRHKFLIWNWILYEQLRWLSSLLNLENRLQFYTLSYSLWICTTSINPEMGQTWLSICETKKLIEIDRGQQLTASTVRSMRTCCLLKSREKNSFASKIILHSSTFVTYTIYKSRWFVSNHFTSIWYPTPLMSDVLYSDVHQRVLLFFRTKMNEHSNFLNFLNINRKTVFTKYFVNGENILSESLILVLRFNINERLTEDWPFAVNLSYLFPYRP